MLFLLGAGSAARGAPCQPLPAVFGGAFDYAAYAPEIRLHLQEMVSLPPDTVVLAGSFRDAANAVHPALLTSQDGGETWSATPVLVHGAALAHLSSDRASTVWGIVSAVQEGTEQALYLLRSRDSARNWCAISLEGLDTLNGVALFRLFDHDHGLIVFSDAPFGGGFRAYQTQDGGENWLLLWDVAGTPPEAVEPPADDPDRAPPSLPHATLWQRESDLLAVHAVLRLRPDGDA